MIHEHAERVRIARTRPSGRRWCCTSGQPRISRTTSSSTSVSSIPTCVSSELHRGIFSSCRQRVEQPVRATIDSQSQIGAWADRDGSGVVFDSSGGFILPNGATRAPDVAWVRRSRLATLTAQQKEKFLPLCPDFVIELCSPSEPLRGAQAKMEEYVANGAQLGWLIDPDQRRVYVYRPGAAVECLDNPQQPHRRPATAWSGRRLGSRFGTRDSEGEENGEWRTGNWEWKTGNIESTACGSSSHSPVLHSWFPVPGFPFSCAAL